MDIYFYSFEYNRLEVYKNIPLTEGVKITGTMRNDIDLLNPVIIIDNSNIPQNIRILNFNYVFITELGRYYFINNINIVNNNLYEIYLSIDVLQTYIQFSTDSVNIIYGKVNRNERNYNPYLVDVKLPVESEPLIEEIISSSNNSGSGWDFNALRDINEDNTGALRYIISTTAYNDSTIYQQITTPDLSYASTPTSCYTIANNMILASFMYGLYNSQASADNQWIEPSETLRHIRVYPFFISDYDGKMLLGDSQEFIRIGKEKLPLLKPFPSLNEFYITSEIQRISSLVVPGGQINIPKKYNNFLDLEPYTIIELYIPFVGWVKLPTNLVIGKTIYSKYIVDIETGIATNEIRIDENKFTPTTRGDDGHLIPAKDNNPLVITTECDIGYDLPLVRMDIAEQSKKERIANIKAALRWVKFATSTLGDVANFAGNALTSLPRNKTYRGKPTAKMKKYQIETSSSGIEMGGDILSNLASTIGENTIDRIEAMQYHATSGQAGDSVLVNCSVGLQLKARISRPVPINIENYGHLYGYPSDYSGKINIGTVSGYTELGSVIIPMFNGMTVDENIMLENLLKSGVYF